MVQSGGFAELMPILTSVSAATTDTQDLADPASMSPAAAAMQADDVPRALVCPVRMAGPENHGDNRDRRRDGVEKTDLHR